MPARAPNGQFVKSHSDARSAETLGAKKRKTRPTVKPAARKRRARALPKPEPVLIRAIEAAARRLCAGDPDLHNRVVEGSMVELARAGELYPTDAHGEIDKHDAWVLVGFVQTDGVITGLRWQDGTLCNRGCVHLNDHHCMTDLQGVRVD